ncbi:ABC transporter substrate-binding protein [Fodinibius sp. AD559]|uniref:ABC transporter substrate-binding protein n=1 Tax=Fodinibius sp. AD559 TaxID=3424179 RepID=UPI004046A8B8
MRYLVTVLLLLFIIGGCQKQDNTTKTLTDVRIGINKSFLGETATFVAREQGFFKKHGLDVSFKNNNSGRQSIRDLLREKVDIAHVAETPVVYALFDTSYIEGANRSSFQIFGDMIYTNEIQHIIARKDHGIKNPNDLENKKIGIYQGTQLEYFLDSFLLEQKISVDNLEVVNMEPSSQVKAILDGDIDVSVTWEPYATYIQQQLGDRAVKLEPELTYSTLWLAVALDGFAEKKPDVLVSYLQAIREAQAYIKDHPKNVQQLLAQETGVPIEVIEPIWGEIDYQLSLSERMLTLLEDQMRWIKRKNNVAVNNFDFTRIINFEPMRNVYPNGITVIQ